MGTDLIYNLKQKLKINYLKREAKKYWIWVTAKINKSRQNKFLANIKLLKTLKNPKSLISSLPGKALRYLTKFRSKLSVLELRTISLKNSMKPLLISIRITEVALRIRKTLTSTT